MRFWHPDEFAEVGEFAREAGFRHVESGPLVRSSHHAADQARAAQIPLASVGAAEAERGD